MEKQLLGQQAPLQKGGEMDMAQKPGSTGTPLFQSFASEADISHRPYDNMPMNTGTRSITKQFMGSEAPLSHTPMHGYESANTPMSERSKRQSD